MEDRHILTDEENQTRIDLISFVRSNVDRLSPYAEDMDCAFSSQACRNYEAAKKCANPYRSEESRSYRRKNYPYDEADRQWGYRPTPEQVVAAPPLRPKGLDGKPKRPEIPLRQRFNLAFQDTFADRRSLDVLAADHREEVAARRVLIAWLRLDPDRGSVKRITEFQDLRNELTANGIGRIWIPDDADPHQHDQVLFVYEDGAVDRDASNWIRKAGKAMAELERQRVQSLPATPDDERPPLSDTQEAVIASPVTDNVGTDVTAQLRQWGVNATPAVDENLWRQPPSPSPSLPQPPEKLDMHGGGSDDTAPSSPPNKNRRKHKRDAGNRIKAEARREIVLNWLQELDGFDGTLAQMREALTKKTGLTVSTSTLSRDTRGTAFQRRRGKPSRAARKPGKRGTEVEAVAGGEGPADMSHLDTFTMPEDLDGD